MDHDRDPEGVGLPGCLLGWTFANSGYSTTRTIGSVGASSSSCSPCVITWMIVAIRAAGAVISLLIIAIYAFGITMHSFMKGDEIAEYECWGSVSRCMMKMTTESW